MHYNSEQYHFGETARAAMSYGTVSMNSRPVMPGLFKCSFTRLMLSWVLVVACVFSIAWASGEKSPDSVPINVPTEMPGLAVESKRSRPTILMENPRSVRTKLGPVHGACTKDGCRWLNVPFSEPFARFERSRPRTSSYGTGVGSGTENGPACFQFLAAAALEGAGISLGTESEDCLNLNIFGPANPASATPLPVMVFVHGGGFLEGSASQDAGRVPGESHGLTYDGSQLAAHGVIVVVIQYRLGVFGFLQQPDGVGGANGIGDQITALRWVNRHISAFNGDPGRVTIFGESAGSVSVCLLSHLPMAAALFKRVIAESGICYPSGDVLLNATEAQQARESFLRRTGLAPPALLTMEASELRNVTLKALDPNGEFTPIFVSGVGQPSVDGDIYPAVATQLDPLDVDLLDGYNSGEVRMSPAHGIPGGAASFFSHYLGDAAENILAQYGADLDVRDLIADACLRCQSVRYAQRVAARAGSQVYFYVYDNPHDASVHGAELPAVFGTANVVKLEGVVLNTSAALVRRTQQIWTDFAKGINISEAVSGDWPMVKMESDVQAMLMGKGTSLLQLATARCAAWEAAEDSVGGFATARMCNKLMV